jgi:hypothetical protein
LVDKDKRVGDAPFRKAVTEIASVEHERVLARLDEVRGHLRRPISPTAHAADRAHPPGPILACPSRRSRTAGRSPYTAPPCAAATSILIKSAAHERRAQAHLVIRMQSPSTGIKSGEMCDMDGCALASSTSSATSIGPGMLRAETEVRRRREERGRTGRATHTSSLRGAEKGGVQFLGTGSAPGACRSYLCGSCGRSKGG